MKNAAVKQRPHRAKPISEAFNLTGACQGELAVFLNFAIYLILAALTAYMLFCIAPAMYARLMFTGPLEQQEDLFLNTVRFFNQGGNIYQLPNLHFAGAIYPPFYVYVVSLFSSVSGLSYFSSRLFSLEAIIGTAWCAYIILHHYTSNRLISLAWLPLWLSIWPLYGWSDLARPEALFLLLMFGGICCFIKAQGRTPYYIAAGVLLGLCAATKQTGLVFLGWAFVLSLFDRRALWTLGAMLFTAVAVYGVSYALFGMGMYEWLVATPYHHIIDYPKGIYVLNTLVTELTGTVLPIPLFVVAIYRARRKKPGAASKRHILIGHMSSRSGDLVFLLFTCGVGLTTAFASMFKDGGGVPNLANLNAFTLLLACYVCADALKGRVAKKIWALGSLALMLLFVFEAVAQDFIAEHTPLPSDSVHYNDFVEFVRRQPGPVWVTTKPWVSIQAGKEAFMAMQQMAGEWASGNPDYPLPPDVVEAIKAKKFAMIITGEEYARPWIWKPFGDVLLANYRAAGMLPPELTIRQFDGSSLAPHYAWVPK